MMEIICTPAAFNRWQAKLVVDGVEECVSINKYPGCAIRDVVNEFCSKYNDMPKTSIKMQVQEWD